MVRLFSIPNTIASHRDDNTDGRDTTKVHFIGDAGVKLLGELYVRAIGPSSSASSNNASDVVDYDDAETVCRHRHRHHHLHPHRHRHRHLHSSIIAIAIAIPIRHHHRHHHPHRNRHPHSPPYRMCRLRQHPLR